MELNRVKLNQVNLNRVQLNTVGKLGKAKGGEPEPEQDITDALLMDNGVLFLMEDGSYFRLEQTGTSTQSTTKFNKSYWNFLK